MCVVVCMSIYIYLGKRASEQQPNAYTPPIHTISIYSNVQIYTTTTAVADAEVAVCHQASKQTTHRQHNGFVHDCWIVNGDDY